MHEAFAVGFHRLFKRIRVGGEVIGGREQFDDLIGEELDTVFVLRFKLFKVGYGLPDRLGAHHILVADEVEIGMRAPERIGETFVGGQVIVVEQGHLALGQRILHFHEMRHRLPPILGLRFQ